MKTHNFIPMAMRRRQVGENCLGFSAWVYSTQMANNEHLLIVIWALIKFYLNAHGNVHI